MEVVEEGEMRSWVSEGCQILDEGDLHLGALEQHASVPCELFLTLNEEHTSSGTQAAVLEGNRNCQRSRPKTHTDEVIWLLIGDGASIAASIGFEFCSLDRLINTHFKKEEGVV